ncbi:hypothetical protein BB559_003715 [Furculomyces boomerangus]|uniref:Uncharacterized protein n=1 Tax=Furculomyces boomerangus TaxID=61424 RepID=A0A2T9YJC7_9FUNG|nr:hypothetical protein BB559_003715 [Furculomyces boomerangus]
MKTKYLPENVLDKNSERTDDNDYDSLVGGISKMDIHAEEENKSYTQAIFKGDERKIENYYEPSKNRNQSNEETASVRSGTPLYSSASSSPGTKQHHNRKDSNIKNANTNESHSHKTSVFNFISKGSGGSNKRQIAGRIGHSSSKVFSSNHNKSMSVTNTSQPSSTNNFFSTFLPSIYHQGTGSLSGAASINQQANISVMDTDNEQSIVELFLP